MSSWKQASRDATVPAVCRLHPVSTLTAMLTRLGVPKLWGNDPERFWEFARAFMVGFLRRVAPTYAYGVERIPTTGGGVVAANHFGTVDPPLIGIHGTRTIYYMSKVELLEI